MQGQIKDTLSSGETLETTGEILSYFNRKDESQIQTAHRVWDYQHEILYKHYFGPKGEVVVCGVNHLKTAEDPQSLWGQIQEKYNSFKAASPNNRVVIVEGFNKEIPSYESLEVALQKDGEAGAIAFLAQRDGIEVLCPEPTLEQERKHLESLQYSQGEGATYQLVRLLASNSLDATKLAGAIVHAFKEVPEVKALTAMNFQQQIDGRDANGNPPTAEQIQSFLGEVAGIVNGNFKELTGMKALIDESGKLLVNDLFQVQERSVQNTTRMRDLVVAIDDYRNKRLYENIIAQAANNSVLVVYGGSHIIQLNPALEDYFQSPELKNTLAGRELLQRLEEEGAHVFHGSPNGSIGVLQPRQGRTSNPQTGIMENDGPPAVFATPIADVAIFRALFNSVNFSEVYGHYSSSFELDENGQLILSATQNLIDAVRDKVGYVYVMENGAFYEGDGLECRTESEIVPSQKVRVTLEDLQSKIRVIDRQPDGE